MKLIIRHNFVMFLFLTLLVGCSDGEAPPATSSNNQSEANAVDYTLSIQAVEVAVNQIELLVSTNIPGTIELMTSINLANQAQDDIYVGKSKKIVISEGSAKVKFDVSDLPSGQYFAEANFYPSWGFKDENSQATGVNKELSALKSIEIEGSGKSAQSVSQKNKNQKWVMENVVMGTSWNANDWKERFGTWTELPVKSRNPKIIKNFYFQSLDMTIVVNTFKKEVITWRVGKDGL